MILEGSMRAWLTFVVILILFSSSCKKDQYFYIEGFAQGTTFHITYEGQRNYSAEIDQILKDFDMSLSSYVDSSIISRINNNDPRVVPDSMFIAVFKKSKEVYETTNGMFDITVGPLVKTWGFLKDTTIRHDSAHIKELLQYVGMNKVKLENNKIIKSNPSVILDVNAIAQGYSVDIVAQFLEKQKSANYLVEIGGEIRAKGINAKGKTWRVGIDKPEDSNQLAGENLQAIVEISNKSLATSGNYRKFFIENGVKYAHTINPKTGYPAKNNLLSATIIASDCMTADAYATACMVGGIEKSKDLLKNIKGLEGYLVYSDSIGNYKIFVTEGLKSMIK
jgi:thiamine biosynthesis lipoprotein